MCLLYFQILTPGNKNYGKRYCSTIFGCQSTGMAALKWWNTNDQTPSNVKSNHEFPQGDLGTDGSAVTDKRWPRPLDTPRPLLQQQQLGSPTERSGARTHPDGSSLAAENLLDRGRVFIWTFRSFFFFVCFWFFLIFHFIDVRKYEE